MRRLNRSAAALAAALLLPLAAQAPMAQGVRPASAEQARVIVKYRADSDMMKKQAMTATGRRTLQAQAMGDRIGVALTAGAGISDRAHVVTGRGLTSGSLAARLAALPDVEYAVVDERKHIVAAPNDPFYASRLVTATSGGPAVGQWYLKPPGLDGNPLTNTAPAAINAEQAWDVLSGGVGSPSIVVAVLDTGLRFDHPDLLANVVPGYDMIAADDSVGGAGGTNFSTANDGNGRDADASDPGDWITSMDKSGNPIFTSCEISNSSWHGTQTLGLIGATTNNGVGIASVGRGVKVMPVRVLGKCGGYDSDILAGMRWAAGLTGTGAPTNPNPARVINLSLGSTGSCSQSYIDTVAEVNRDGVGGQGTIVVASAGNTAGHPVSTPANCPGVIAVAGLRHVGDKVGFSDIGPQIAISAPGGNCVNIVAGTPCLYPMMTTANSGTTTPVAGAAGAIYTDSFGTASLGTSFSAPLVAGTVGLMLSVKPTMTPAEVKSTLQASARPFPTTGGSPGTLPCNAPVAGVDQLECYCTTTTCGAGMLDAHAAVIAAIGVQARLSVTTAAPIAGQPVSIASTSVIGAGQSATYLWTITSAGTTGATITGANNGSTVTVTPTAAGVFTISLTTTDNNGYVSTASTAVTVAAVVVMPPPSSGGGGGALGTGWLLLLLSAVLALAALSRFERRGAARAISAPARAARRR